MSRCRSLIAVVALSLVATAPGGEATLRSETRPSPRLDTQVQQAVQQRTAGAHRVILRVRPGAERPVRQALAAHGARVYADHASLHSIAAEIQGEDLATFAASEHIESISSDARVQGYLLGLVGGLLDAVTGVLDPGEIDTSQQPLAPKTLRATLGLGSTSWTGRGVGVAVIDSGIAATADFDTRITAFYNFTNGGLVAMLLLTDQVWVSPGQWGSVAVFAFLMACLGSIVVNRASRSDVTFAFTFNRTPKQVASATCALSGQASVSGPCDTPVLFPASSKTTSESLATPRW